MALTNINSEDSLVLQTFADHLQDVLGKDSVYALASEKLAIIRQWWRVAAA